MPLLVLSICLMLAPIINCFYHLLHLNVMCFKQNKFDLIDFDLCGRLVHVSETFDRFADFGL